MWGPGFKEKEVLPTTQVGLLPTILSTKLGLWLSPLSAFPGQGGGFELRGGPGVWPEPGFPGRPVVPAAEEQPHVERGGAGRTVVPPGCLLGCRGRGCREQVVHAQVRHVFPC